MSLIATAVKHMMDAGMQSDAILAAIADMECQITPARSKGAERQARYRERNKSSQTVTSDDNVTSTPFPAPPKDNNQTPPTHTPVNISRARKETPFSNDWVPILTPAAQKIVDGWPPGMFDRQVALFRDHAADKGRKSKDWQAAFRTWIGKADDWKPQNGTSRKHQPDGMGVTERAARQAMHEISGGKGRFADSRGEIPASDFAGSNRIIDAVPDAMRAIGYAGS